MNYSKIECVCSQGKDKKYFRFGKLINQITNTTIKYQVLIFIWVSKFSQDNFLRMKKDNCFQIRLYFFVQNGLSQRALNDQLFALIITLVIYVQCK